MFLSATFFARRNGHNFSASYMLRLEKMVEFILYLTKPDGTVPLIGDNDNGRLHRLKVWDPPLREWSDFRYLLAIGAVLFQREDFAQAADDQWEEAIWMCGPEALLVKEQLASKQPAAPALTSRAFPDAGIYIIRHDDLYIAVDAGPVGQNGYGGHAHNDIFSIEFYANGHTWIIDPGLYLYTADHQARNQFRSVLYHNTISIDRQEQHKFDPAKLFRMSDRVHPRIIDWQVSSDVDLFIAEHRGYERLKQPVVHRRGIVVDKEKQACLILDQLAGVGKHTGTSILNSNCGVLIQQIAQNQIRLSSFGENGAQDFMCDELLVIVDPHLSLNRRPSLIAPGYGTSYESEQLVCNFELELEEGKSIEFITMLLAHPLPSDELLIWQEEKQDLIMRTIHRSWS
jgi:hypothetical protein